ncbi:MAG TPA: M20/M25/M40 family metallo-hydrolase [Bryobacteraceae bacterium]|nr:M20/M25/M40 family metallo-hydrolase [Bryobacteraceae bacterium]
MRFVLVLVLGCGFVQAQPPDRAAYDRFRSEGFQRSQVMQYAEALIDGIGPRLTGSPNFRKAMDWAQRELRAMGCENVRPESWGEFGMGWRQLNVWARLVTPDTAPMIVQAAPWSPGTSGTVHGEVVAVGIRNPQDFAQYRGKLAGKIVLFGSPPPLPLPERPFSHRLSDKELEDFAREPVDDSAAPSDTYEKVFQMFAFRETIGRFLADEKVAAVLTPSANNAAGGASGGTMYVDTNYTFGWPVYRREHAMGVPLLLVANEHYGRITRLLKRRVPVTVEARVDAEFTGDREHGFNVFADLPGVHATRKDEIVLLSAHLDSWTAGTGATDDGAGVVIVMEAMRILHALKVKPKRTIRLALWGGEEQGALGSRAFISRYVADLPTADSAVVPEFLRPSNGPPRPKEMHKRISAALTVDAGGGRIRGVSVSGNAALIPLFQEWVAPLKDLGVSIVRLRGDCGGDCAAFEKAGIPTPSFKQDPLEYETRSQHTNMDTLERLHADDLRQAATVVATVIYNIAMADEMLPRRENIGVR